MTEQQPKTFQDFAGVEWVYLENADLDGAQTRVPYSPDVVEHFAARGWQPVDPPDETTPTVAKATDVAEGGEWVELVHPELQARHQFPNHPDAIAGAADAGWVEPNKDGSIPKRRRTPKAATEPAPAADEAASSEDTENPDADPAPETQQDEAGDSTATTKEG